LLEGVRADLRCCCHAQALDQGQDGPDNPGEDRGAIWIFRTEVWLHADHPRRLQACGLQHRPQARPFLREDPDSAALRQQIEDLGEHDCCWARDDQGVLGSNFPDGHNRVV
jgi:hypothetical protein